MGKLLNSYFTLSVYDVLQLQEFCQDGVWIRYPCRGLDVLIGFRSSGFQGQGMQVLLHPDIQQSYVGDVVTDGQVVNH